MCEYIPPNTAHPPPTTTTTITAAATTTTITAAAAAAATARTFTCHIPDMVLLKPIFCPALSSNDSNKVTW